MTDLKQPNDCPCVKWELMGTEKQFRAMAEGAHHPDCDGTGNRVTVTTPEGVYDARFLRRKNGTHFTPPTMAEIERMRQPTTELSLLVIDLGEQCAIKVEKGLLPKFLRDRGYHHGLGDETVALYWRTFTELREALEVKPVPRIERDAKGDLRLHIFERIQGNELQIVSGDYDALSQLAGHPLPVFVSNEGSWECLTVSENLPVKVWRFSK